MYAAVSHEEHPLSPCSYETLHDLWLSIATSPDAEFYQATSNCLEEHGIRYPKLFFRQSYRQEATRILDSTCFHWKTFLAEKVLQVKFWVEVVERLGELGNIENIRAKKTEIISKCLFQYGDGIRSLDIQIDVRHDEYFTKAFEVVGRTLESLSFKLYAKNEHLNEQHFNISTIVDLCPHVRHLSTDVLCTIDSMRRKIEGLYYAYGERLRFISLFGAERTAFLQKTCSSCPNAMFILFYGTHKSPVNALSILGVAIHSVSWHPSVSIRDMDLSVLSAAASKCFKIECLGLVSSTSEPKDWTIAFFQAPKPKLRQLSLTSLNGEEMSTVVAAGALNTGALEDVSLQCPQIPVDVLQKLAYANPLFEKFTFYHVSENVPRVSAEECGLYFAHVISSLSRCQKLRSLSFRSDSLFSEFDSITSKQEAILNACVKLRHRNVSVRVDDIEYI